MQIKYLNSLAEIFGNFDAFLVDLWGVVHDGQKLYPGVKETLEILRKKNKEIIFLSNAPRRAYRVVEVLTNLVVTPEYYDCVVTSGEVAFEHLQRNPIGKFYYSIGPERDAGLLNNSPYIRVASPDKADFAIVTGFDDDNSGLDEKLPELEKCFAAKLPFICTNPDMEIVRQDGTRALCAGVMAKAYMEMGGEVQFFGKPYAEVYNRCFELLKIKDKEKIAAIGDNFETDIRGANNAGLYSVLVSGGVMAKALEIGANGLPDKQALNALSEKYNAVPSAVAPAFN